jgi:undecaprenyl-diphosphatase
MDWLQILVLSVMQGLTEFLPISSSAHLILVPVLTDWEDQGLAFDVAVHVGTLVAVVSYFHRELRVILRDGFTSIAQRRRVGDSNLFWAVGLGTIPVGLAGLLFKDVIETSLRSPLVLAMATILFGLLLWWADRMGKRERDEHGLGWKDIVFIGLAQALALIPGTSRSGITITAGLLLGLSRQAAARFSFLLSIPVILLAGGLYTVKLVQAGVEVDWSVLIGGALLSGLTAYLCIHYFLKLLERIGMLPFVIYRLLLGAVLLVIFW